MKKADFDILYDAHQLSPPQTVVDELWSKKCLKSRTYKDTHNQVLTDRTSWNMSQHRIRVHTDDKYTIFTMPQYQCYLAQSHATLIQTVSKSLVWIHGMAERNRSLAGRMICKVSYTLSLQGTLWSLIETFLLKPILSSQRIVDLSVYCELLFWRTLPNIKNTLYDKLVIYRRPWMPWQHLDQ